MDGAPCLARREREEKERRPYRYGRCFCLLGVRGVGGVPLSLSWERVRVRVSEWPWGAEGPRSYSPNSWYLMFVHAPHFRPLPSPWPSPAERERGSLCRRSGPVFPSREEFRN